MSPEKEVFLAGQLADLNNAGLVFVRKKEGRSIAYTAGNRKNPGRGLRGGERGERKTLRVCDVPQTKGGHSFKKEGSTGSNIPKESEKDWEGRESSGSGNTEVTGDDDKSRFCDEVGMEPRGSTWRKGWDVRKCGLVLF